MDEQAFWRLIHRIDRTALPDDEDAAVEPLITELTTLERTELASFEEHLALVLYALDGKKYADAAGEAGQSGDGFLYVRCYVVAQGEAHYRSVLADPSLLPTSVDHWCEALLNAASDAIEAVTGEAVTLDTSVSYETGSNRAGWDES
jgi:hypothetical protein